MIYFIILLAILIIGVIQVSGVRYLDQKIERNLREIEKLKKPESRREY